MLTLFFILLGLCAANAERHSWRAYYTGTTGLSGFPEFVALNLIDDEVMGYFDSNTKRFKSQFKWMEDNLGKDYDDGQSNILQGNSAVFHNNIRIAMERFNQTQGVHTVQYMYGCEVDDQTGHTSGFDQFGYDGEDFVSLDQEQQRYVSPVPQGVVTAQKWNSGTGQLEGQRNYLSTICVEGLQKYLGYRKSSQQERVSPPQVSVLRSSSSSSPPPLSCHATGFYPPLVTISWTKDGEEVHEDVSLGDLLPNEDGTFQKSSSLSVSPEEQQKHSFSCVVEHQGKRVEEREIRSNSGAGDSAGIIIGVGVGAAVLLILVAGAVAWCVIQKKRGEPGVCSGFKPVSGSDDGSNSSAHINPNA